MENLYLKKEDELFSIINKIKLSRDFNITLIVPSGTIALKSIINLRLLKEECIYLNKSICIITPDALIKKLSQQAGIAILERQESMYQAEKPVKMGRVVDLRQKTMSDVVYKEIEEPIIEESIIEEPTFSEPLPLQPEKIKKNRHFKFPKIKVFVWIILILGALSGLAYLVLVVLPRAQIVINPKKEEIRFDTEFTVDKNISAVDIGSAKIPGQLFQFEDIETKEFPATGEKQVEEKASGKIVVYNQFSSSAQTLVKTTRFKSPDGKIFRLTETTTIPGATIEEGKIIPSTKEVNVIADAAGEAYNIGPSDFTIPGFEGTPKYTAFYGKSTAPMTGGAIGKMKIATATDISGAMSIVTVELKNKVSKAFQEKIPKNLKLLKDSQALEVIESSSSLKANQVGEKFVITVKVKAFGLAFKEEDALYLVQSNAGKEVPKNKTILLSTIKIDYQVSNLDLKQGKLILLSSAGAQMISTFDEQKIRDDLAGKGETEVRKYLSSLPNIETAKVVFWPFWVDKIPLNKNKIKINVEIK